jgi:hypothetical protein
MGLFDRLKGLNAKYESSMAKEKIDEANEKIHELTTPVRERRWEAARKKEEAKYAKKYEAKRQQAISDREDALVKEYGLERTNRPGRYIAGGNKVIDINVGNYDDVESAITALESYRGNPKKRLQDVTKSERSDLLAPPAANQDTIWGRLADIGQNFNANAGGSGGYDIGNFDFIGGGPGGYDIGNYDFIGGGFGGDYDFFGGGTSKPRKRKKSSGRKKRK